MTRTLTVHQVPRLGYEEACRLQHRCVDALWKSGRDEGVLILLEHPPAITIGRSGTEKNILAASKALEVAGVAIHETSRGGDVTYHGPGQIIGYPIIPLQYHGKDIHRYLRDLEAVLMAVLKACGITSFRREGYTGVWTDRGKIASIGVAVRHWITYHGVALNLAPNMEHFRLIRPCGIDNVTMVCMKDFLDETPSREAVELQIIDQFRRHFGFGKTEVHHDSPGCTVEP